MKWTVVVLVVAILCVLALSVASATSPRVTSAVSATIAIADNGPPAGLACAAQGNDVLANDNGPPASKSVVANNTNTGNTAEIDNHGPRQVLTGQDQAAGERISPTAVSGNDTNANVNNGEVEATARSGT